MNFENGTTSKWFRLPDNNELPSTFNIEYRIRAIMEILKCGMDFGKKSIGGGLDDRFG